MYNTAVPSPAELPSSKQLFRSTIIAIVSAAVLLVTVVLPAEYGIDPTGVGSALRLTEMGEIKSQLAAEAATDAQADAKKATAGAASVPLGAAETGQSSAPANVSEESDTKAASTSSTTPTAAEPLTRWRDETRFTLAPGQGIEIKLRMKEGAQAKFAWAVEGTGAVNFDTHGDGGGRSISYEKGRGVPSDEGTLVAAFTGNHGWFWRNRGNAEVALVLRTEGDYIDIQRPRM